MNGVPHLPGKPNSVGILLSVGTADVSLNGPSGHRETSFSIGQSPFLYGRAVGYYALWRGSNSGRPLCDVTF